MARSNLSRQHVLDTPAPWRVRFGEWLEAALTRTFWGLCALLSVERASAMGAGLLQLAGPHLPKHRHVMANMAHLLPDADEAHRTRVAARMWANFGAVFAEYPHLYEIAASRIDVQIDDAARAAMRAGGPMVFVAGHLANWELVAAQIVAEGLPLTAVYARVQNPRIDEMLVAHRRQLGCHLVEKQASARELVAALRRGDCVGLLADQRVDNGEPVDFFDQPALTASTPARLAIRFDAPMIPIELARATGARFRMRFHDPIPVPEQGDAADPALWMTARYMALLQQWIERDPGSWLCTKRRWPKARYVERDLAAYRSPELRG